MAATPAQGQISNIPVSQFSKIQVCTPFSVLIKPGSSYAVTLVAEAPVKNALSASVGSDGTLTLGTKQVESICHTFCSVSGVSSHPDRQQLGRESVRQPRRPCTFEA